VNLDLLYLLYRYLNHIVVVVLSAILTIFLLVLFIIIIIIAVGRISLFGPTLIHVVLLRMCFYIILVWLQL
jgi:hypothetical protein